jgi:glucosamine--fructose-6-phosphate aminotransferase (isomerizing)
LEGLQRLEYRGYDSAGLAVVRPSGLAIHKVKGRISDLAATLPKRLRGSPGIGHTRWATHGEPSDVNAHPHMDASGRIAVVHNGIVENSGILRAKLEGEGVVFASHTDSEVLAHLIARAEADDLEEAVRRALSFVEGAYGIAVIDAECRDRLVVARNGSPVVLGIGDHEHLVASDVAALVRHTDQVVYLDDGELAVVRASEFRSFGLDAAQTTKTVHAVSWDPGTYDKGDHAHFFRKEVLEQPEALARTLSGRLDHRFGTAHLGGLDLSPADALRISRVKILGCGSAFYAGLAGAQLVETLARIPADAEPASEFRYRNPVIEPDALYVAVSQSGETADTLRAVQEIKRKGGRVLGVVNAVGSSVARECDGGIYLHAGPEVSVTSTKTFTCTVTAFALLALFLGRIRDLGPADGARLLAGLDALPALVGEALASDENIDEAARLVSSSSGAFFLGRVRGYPIALEGAQKLKEVSYIHAEAYPASELKHGPLALVSPDLPTVAVLPDDDLLDKNLSTVEEIRSRQGPLIALGQTDALADVSDIVLRVPACEPELDPVLLTVPLQLLAYHAATILERDIDHPRNLAKSVTVE